MSGVRLRDLTEDERVHVARASDLYVEYALAHARELGLPVPGDVRVE